MAGELECSQLAGGIKSCKQRWRKAMKKISLIGLVLGAVLGIVAGLMAGSWLFWLGMGLVAGVLIGSAGARRSRLPRSNVGAGNLNV
jgi:hypothetical protein